MRQLIYLTGARNDLRRIAANIALESGSRATAVNFVARIRGQCARLAALPGVLGRSRPELLDDMRSFPFGRYLIFFRYRSDAVEIIDILEAHRDIDAWFKSHE
jgi:toxin ParE1/3/4